MKKRTTLLCICATLLTLGACSSNKIDTKAIDNLNLAIAHVASLSSAKSDIKLIMDAPDKNIKAKLELNMELLMENKLEMKMKLHGSANGIRLDDIASFYVKDNMLYTDVMGSVQQKQEITASKVNEDIKQKPPVLTKEDVKKSFKEVSMQEENGDKIIHIVPTDVAKQDLIKNLKEQFEGKKDVGLETIKDISFDVTITKNNELKNAICYIDVIYKDLTKTPTQSIPMNIKLELALHEYNTLKTIEFPDFKDFMIAPDADDSLSILDKYIGEGIDL